ncbi:MAG: nitroreductase [Nitrososphaerota archaeon]|jgi:nitroreductase|nr:nitroreductase [Nitrososphaerota archaeon]
MLSLGEVIYKRKSVRKYLSEPLDEKTLKDIEEYFTKIKPLYCDIKVNFNIVGKDGVRGLTSRYSPHYIVVISENKKGYLVNVGFMLQQVDLYLSSIGLGGCWLGMVQPKETSTGDEGCGGLEFVIVFGFGKSAEGVYRELAEFKRKPLGKLSDTADGRLEVVRLAPSAMNLQNYYFVTEDNNVFHVYCAKAGLLTLKRLVKMREIDVGIALAHLYVANSSCFSFFEAENPKEIDGYYYVGSVELLTIK